MKKLKQLAKLCFAMAVTTCGTSQRLSSDQLPDGTEYYFSIFGDSRDGNDMFSNQLSRSIRAGKPLATIHLGDMISTHHNTEQWPSFVSLTRTYVDSGRFYPVIGNHDVADTKSLDLFLAVFPQLKRGYTAEQIGDCYCIFLNSEDQQIKSGIIGPTQLAWLQTELESEASKKARFRMVFIHRPPYPQNHHKDEPLEQADFLHQLFLDHHVTAVFSGHEHSYGRMEKDGLHYVVSGGAGSPLYQPAGYKSAFFHYVQVAYQKTALQFRVIDHMGVVRDEFTVQLPEVDGDSSAQPQQ